MPPRKIKHEPVNKPATERSDTSHSVLGGLAGGYRLSGSESSHATGVTNFSIPFQDKAIVCQRLQYAAPSDDSHTPLIFTHGAGGGIANPATTQFAQGFASHRPVTLFQGTMNLQSRVKTFQSVIEHESRSPIAVGGRSMGARAAILASQDCPEATHLILVSYPLTNDKGTDIRDQVLLDIPQEKAVLFIIGDNDKLCDLSHLSAVRRKMQARSWCIVVNGADHSMSAKPTAAVEPLRQRTGQLAAEWLGSHTQYKTEHSIRWDSDRSSVKDDRAWSDNSFPKTLPATTAKAAASRKRSVRPSEVASPRQLPKRRRAPKS